MRLWFGSRIRDWVETRVIDRLVGCVVPRIEDTEQVVSVQAGWIRDLQARTASQASLIKAYRDETDALRFRAAAMEQEIQDFERRIKGLRREFVLAERRITKIERTIARVSNAQADRIEAIESRLDHMGDLLASRTDVMSVPSVN